MIAAIIATSPIKGIFRVCSWEGVLQYGKVLTVQVRLRHLFYMTQNSNVNKKSKKKWRTHNQMDTPLPKKSPILEETTCLAHTRRTVLSIFSIIKGTLIDRDHRRM